MSKLFSLSYHHVLNHCKNVHQKNIRRTFLSNAYYCNEVWDSRLNTPLLQKVHLDELYHELENNFSKTKNISAVDVDIFANAVKDDSHTDELLDLIHKLRLSAETCNTLQSTEHAVIRYMIQFGAYDRLLQVLDDRLNYGMFLDDYTANLLLDTFWKKNDYTSGAKVAAQIMLQEEFSNELVRNLSLLHCFKFLQKPEGWEEPTPVVEESKEEVRVRVKFLRNPYNDDHFDLKNPMHLIGKTLTMIGSQINDAIGRSFKLIGLALQNNPDKAKVYLNEIQNETVVTEVLNLLPDDNEIKTEALKLRSEDLNVQTELESRVRDTERISTEKDIAEQCKLYEKWIKVRLEALEEQQKRLEIAQRLSAIEESQAKLKEKELQLWYFDRKEQLELEIEGKKVFYPKRWFGKKKVPKKIDESYIPPEVKTFYSKEK